MNATGFQATHCAPRRLWVNYAQFICYFGLTILLGAGCKNTTPPTTPKSASTGASRTEDASQSTKRVVTDPHNRWTLEIPPPWIALAPSQNGDMSLAGLHHSNTIFAVVYNQGAVSTADGDGPAPFVVTVFENPKQLSPDAFFTDDELANIAGTGTRPKAHRLKLGGQDWYSFAPILGEETTFVYLMGHGKWLFEVDTIYPSQGAEPIIEEMFASFKEHPF